MRQTPTISKTKSIAMALGLLGAWTAQAQDGFYVAPSLGIAELYDDNIFYSTDEKEDDFITRLSPGLEAGYESRTLNGFASYSFDAEYYAENEDLSEWFMREYAGAGLEYLPGSRLALGVEASYTVTQTPDELNLTTGLLPGRDEGQQTAVRPYLTYQFSAATGALLEYEHTNSELSDGVEGDVYRSVAEVEHIWTPQTSLLVGYTHRDYEFSEGEGSSSHTPRLGVEHQLTPRTLITAEAGPRISDDDEVDPYVLLGARHSYTNGEVQVQYLRDETTLIGEAGRFESETLSGSLIHQLGPRWELRLVPRYSIAQRPDSEAEIFNLRTAASYRISNGLFFDASYQFGWQEEAFPVARDRDLTRNVFLLGFRYTYPRPGDGGSEEN